MSVICSANPCGSWFKPSRYLTLDILLSWPNSDSSSISDFYSRSPDQPYPLADNLRIYPCTTTLLSLPCSLYWLCPIICNVPLMWTHPYAFPNYTLLWISLNLPPYSIQYTTPYSKSLDLRWMEKMAGRRGKPDDEVVYCIALWASAITKHLIVTTFGEWKPNIYRMFCVCAVTESTRVDVAMFSSAPCTLRLYIEYSLCL